MNIKKKFESIDQSQLNQSQKEILGKIKTATKDFTITDEKALQKVDGALDNIITKLKTTNPQAIKGEAKKEEPKAKKEEEKKQPKSETKKPKKEKKEAGGKRTIFSIAKEIRKADESWEDAKARAKKVMDVEREETTKKMKSETEKLLAFIKRRKELEGLSGTSIKKDSKVEALPKGKRVSKKGWKNQYGESEGGRVYYENRDNRTDRLAPNFADKIYLEGGGYAGGGYVVIAKSEKGGGFVMSKPTTKAKAEKLKSLLPKIDGETNEVMTIGKASKLSGLVGKEDLKYADGGTIIGTPETPLGRGLDVDYTTLVGETGAMSSGEMFAGGGGIPNNYDGKYYGDIWNKEWSDEQKSHFLSDHVNEIGFNEELYGTNGKKSTKKEKSSKGSDVGFQYIDKENLINSKSYDLPRYVKFSLEKHIREGQYGSGGYAEKGVYVETTQEEIDLSDDGKPRVKRTQEGKKMSEAEWLAKHNDSMEARAYDNGGSITDVTDAIFYPNQKNGKIKTGFGDKTKEGLFAMISNVNYDAKEISDAIFEFNEKSGKIKTGFGSKTKQGLTEMIKNVRNTFAEGGSLGNHGLKQGDQIIKTMSGGVQKVKTKSGDIVYVNLANGYRGAEPPLPFDKGGFMTDPNFGNFQNQVYAEKGAKIDNSFNYMMLSRLKMDCNYYLGNGNRNEKVLWAGNVDDHIEEMKKLWNGLPKNAKPEWLTMNDILDYEKKMKSDSYEKSGMKFADGGTIDAFQMRMVRGVDNKPSEVFTNEQQVQFAKGGGVGKKKTQKELRIEYLENLGEKEADVWDKIGAESGSEIRNDEKMLRAYAEGVEEMLQKEGVGKGSFDQEDYEFYVDENWHLFNEFLVWNGYYEPEMTKTEKAWREDKFKDPKYRNYVSNPSVIKVSGSSKSKSKSGKYIVKADIKEVKVKTDAGYEYTFKGSDVLNGVNVLEKGSLLKNNATYVAKRNIMYVELKNGERIKPANGYWVKKDAKGELFKPEKKEEYKVMSNQAIFPKRGAGTYWYVENSKGQTINNTTGKPYKGKEMTNYYFLNEEGAKKFAEKLNNSSFEGGGKTTNNEPREGDLITNIGTYGSRITKVADSYVEFYDNKAMKTVVCKKSDLVLNNLDDDGDDDGYYEDEPNSWICKKSYEGGGKTTKTSKSGSTKRGGAMQLAKQIRKDGESWQSALKRANEQMKKK